MKKLGLLIAIIIINVSCNRNDNNPIDSLFQTSSKQGEMLKRYEVESGIVNYKTTISGKVLSSTIKGSGTEVLYFKDWGAIELKETKSTKNTQTVIMGKETIEATATHQMTKLDNGDSFIVDFKNKTISQQKYMAMKTVKNIHTNNDAGEIGKSMLEKMGGKNMGTEVIIGYQCEIWETLGVKQWIYKGVTLKSEANLMGVTTITEAIKVAFNTSIPASNFELPNFKIIKQENFVDNDDEYPDSFDSDEISEEDMEKLRNMSFEKWKRLVQKKDPEMKEASDEELHQIYETIQFLVKKRE